jgi:hypothetical protein
VYAIFLFCWISTCIVCFVVVLLSYKLIYYLGSISVFDLFKDFAFIDAKLFGVW